uniref:Uncharacterized protein n=1 Tax=Chromera velia CCMP2878 TaxID=1169474 RepID=A0A0G4HSI9_9ALVE|eukprot:Cvel_8299.t1-p1 / transcript=Cvel_8299.t1 / gene=Cvel_8299 / organism=Chromera_velia_CCMP2878 / gene_product=hypothetical protein / transcript_product=hypothetical protein / location=Cvel_scaffold455:65668-69108(-) / protein_length=567 / sequence_SO=supercontig / SO=protein_coding / is_pseudo=false
MRVSFSLALLLGAVLVSLLSAFQLRESEKPFHHVHTAHRLLRNGAAARARRRREAKAREARKRIQEALKKLQQKTLKKVQDQAEALDDEQLGPLESFGEADLDALVNYDERVEIALDTFGKLDSKDQELVLTSMPIEMVSLGEFSANHFLQQLKQSFFFPFPKEETAGEGDLGRASLVLATDGVAKLVVEACLGRTASGEECEVEKYWQTAMNGVEGNESLPANYRKVVEDSSNLLPGELVTRVAKMSPSVSDLVNPSALLPFASTARAAERACKESGDDVCAALDYWKLIIESPSLKNLETLPSLVEACKKEGGLLRLAEKAIMAWTLQDSERFEIVNSAEGHTEMLEKGLNNFKYGLSGGKLWVLSALGSDSESDPHFEELIRGEKLRQAYALFSEVLRTTCEKEGVATVPACRGVDEKEEGIFWVTNMPTTVAKGIQNEGGDDEQVKGVMKDLTDFVVTSIFDQEKITLVDYSTYRRRPGKDSFLTALALLRAIRKDFQEIVTSRVGKDTGPLLKQKVKDDNTYFDVPLLFGKAGYEVDEKDKRNIYAWLVEHVPSYACEEGER